VRPFWWVFNLLRRWSEDRQVPDAHTVQQLHAVWDRKVVPFPRPKTPVDPWITGGDEAA